MPRTVRSIRSAESASGSERRPAMSLWLPIATAPSERRVLIVTSERYVSIGIRTTMPDGERWWMKQSRLPFLNEPTHWMPLPDPPATREEDQ